MQRREGLVMMCGAALGLALVGGCGGYPEVQDGRSIELIAALRTACSTKHPGRLEKVAQAVEDRHAAGDLPDAEHEAFRQIIAIARDGRWKDAEMQAFRFQEDQVR